MKDLRNALVPVLGFAACSGTGKTTLLIRLIPRLRARGLRVGLIKHSHHAFEIDYPGKDSHELRMAGANPVMLSSSHRRALIKEHVNPIEPVLEDELTHFDQSGLDLILVEGFRTTRFPKIELHRTALGKPLLLPGDECIIAVASDADPDIAVPVPWLDLNNPDQIATFIVHDFLSASSARSLR